MKIINVDAEEGDGMTLEEIAEEIRLTMSLSHENVVKIFDFYVTKVHVYVIMELLGGGELLDAVMELGSYGERDAATIMGRLFNGLESIHSKNISHRDLKLENLILAVKNDLTSLRIADFGLAKKMKTSRGKLSAQCGSPAYVAPEVIMGQQYTPAVDMWAAGRAGDRGPPRPRPRQLSLPPPPGVISRQLAAAAVRFSTLASTRDTQKLLLALRCCGRFWFPDLRFDLMTQSGVAALGGGVIMYALLCGELPFYDPDEQEMFRLIAKAGPYTRPLLSST